ncbi:MAG: beta-ketoacyl synthase N-terminal-like domain-containing protein [Candidatus Thiodiazotropha sp.]
MERQLRDHGLAEVRVLAIESLKRGELANRPLPRIYPTEIAYIQYTSGSTSSPKGVVLRHSSVIAHMRQLQHTFGLDEPARVAGWIPLHHDMGLVGYLFIPLFEGGLGVFMPPKAFLLAPDVWLKAVSQYRANLSAAPTFAFEYLCRKVEADDSPDLSHWNRVCVGAETVALPVLDRFCQKFAAAGFKRNAFLPVYGLAEATLLAAGGRYGLADLDSHILKAEDGWRHQRALIPYPLNEGVEIEIRNPETGEKMVAGEQGEIWLRGPSISVGYLETRAADTAFPEQPEINSGDLGFVQNGFLYVTGRAKDIVIVRGVNYLAEDLEFAARENQPLLRSDDHCICVSGIEDSAERFYVFQEVQRHMAGAQFVRLVEGMQANLLDSYSIRADEIVFVPRGTLPRTTNYKITRQACLERHQRGELKVLYANNDHSGGEKAIEEDPVVVVGMACRFPGDASDPEAFWKLLIEGGDGITEVPAERWDNDVFYDAKPTVPGKINTKWAGFVDGIDQFDATLFGVSEVEAPELDPQQRMLLETSWRLIENTGWKKSQLAGSDTGVFIGISTNDYLYMKIKLSPGMESFSAYSGLGNANSVAANRLSFFYDLKGPSMAVDTACSSSLSAFHLGTRAVLNGDCSQAIIGGVNAILSPGPTITLSQFGMMSPVGRCKTFDESADGYVRAEGCGLVMLKRRSAALRDGDAILAVVAASEVGQDGFSGGITYPNSEAQGRVLRRCLAASGLRGSDINYIEAHGTGTPSGDPVEMEQIRKVYGAPGDDLCHVGAVKANVGHLEAAAGVAGIIKCLLMFQQRMIPPQIHFNRLNSHILLQETRLQIPTEKAPWQPLSEQCIAAVSSFGFGGSLAHIILKQADEVSDRRKSQPKDQYYYHQHPFVLSAPSQPALQKQAAHWLSWLKAGTDIPVRDLCYTQAVGRSDLKHRAYLLVDSISALKDKLGAFLRHGRHRANKMPDQIGFLFTGQGEHYLHMGRELYYRFPVFQQAFDRCAAAIAIPDGQLTLQEMAFETTNTHVWGDAYMQPILFAVQYALAILWQEAGIQPNVLLGHSLGEYAAACLAGCFEPETGMRLLQKRAELTGSLGEKGFMATIFTGHEVVCEVMDGSRAQIAAINSTDKTVVSGEIDEVTRLISHFEALGIESYRLKTDQAFHSHLVEPILDEYQAFAEQFEFNPPAKLWLSSLRGDFMKLGPDACHWRDHLRCTVLFADAAKRLDSSRNWAFLEVGPGASTLAAMRENMPSSDGMLLRSLNIKKGDRTEFFYFLDSLGKLYQSGVAVQWQNLLSGCFCPERIPGQYFMHNSYWIEGFNAEALTAFARTESGAPAQLVPQKEKPGIGHYALEWVADTTDSAMDLGGALSQNPENWLIVAKPTPLASRLVSLLRDHQKSVFWVAVTPQGSQADIKPDAWLGADADEGEWRATIALFENFRRQAGLRDWEILYLAQGEATIDSEFAEDVDAEVKDCTGMVIPMFKALKANGLAMSLWIVCENSQWIPKSDSGEKDYLNLSLATLWGFAKTLFLEHPEWRGGLIDISRDDPVEQSMEMLLRKVLKPSGEPCVAVRATQQFIQQIVPRQVDIGDAIRFRGDGTFLITGGLGGLGLECARWVAANGGKHVLLLSRRTLPAPRQWPFLDRSHEHYPLIQQLLDLKKSGVMVDVVAMDVRDIQGLETLLKRFTIRGIIHAAGTNWFAKVMDLDRGKFLETLKIKTSSAWALHQLSLACDLDCFVMFSSVSALWGSVELSHYTAANHYMDMLSVYRACHGLPATCVNWGPWAEVGMSAKPHEVAVLQQLGFRLMPSQVALQALAQAIHEGRPLSLISDIDWDKFQTFTNFSLQPSLFAKVVTEVPTAIRSAQAGLAQIRNSPPDRARALIEDIVRMELRMVMLIESIDDVDAEQRFNFLGMDSLMAISFAAKLEEYFGCKLPNTLAYNYPHIKAVTDHLFECVYQDTAVLVDLRQHEAVSGPQAGKWFKVLKRAGDESALTLFCFPYAGAGASVYAGWAGILNDNVELVAVNPPGREHWSDVAPYTSLDTLVEQLEKEFIVPGHEFWFFGHSLGALMAYAFYQRLKSQGRLTPAKLVLSGCAAPANRPQGDLHTLPSDVFVSKVAEYCINPSESISEFESLIRADIQMVEQYGSKTDLVDVPLTVIAGARDPVVSIEDVKAWKALAGNGFEFFSIQGGHDLVKAHSEAMVDIIKPVLEQFDDLDMSV